MQANEPPQTGIRERYQRDVVTIRRGFEAGQTGLASVAARAELVDDVVQELWAGAPGVALVAVGGYGRGELFPFSDVDLMFLLDAKVAEKDLKEQIRRISQELWDCGLRVSPVTRRLSECGRFDPSVPEFTLSLLDHRFVTGDREVHGRLASQVMPKLLEREGKAILASLLEVTRVRHKKYGDTLFHLEPNIKECPGGLRDVHVCRWIDTLRGADRTNGDEEFRGATEFLTRLRCFLHYRHERDDNTLDWQTQDAAAAQQVGLTALAGIAPDVAYWMRVYFRHARVVERQIRQQTHTGAKTQSAASRLRAFRLRRPAEPARHGYTVEQGCLALNAADSGETHDPASDPDVVLQLMSELALTGGRLDPVSEERLSQALPLLSSQLEEGAAVWLPLRKILTGPYAGEALRAMHAIGLLELLIPEFHGIDALVIRDAYHRYTVDEHTFVVIDTLHRLREPRAFGSAPSPLLEWISKFSDMLRDLAHPELLYLAALLHDTGKGRSTGEHAVESVRMARGVVGRLELDGYESGLVLSLIENHLEMSAATRRDIFDAETVRGFAAKVATPEALRMLTLFTYADITAVHPEALTPWKAENLWRLYIATANLQDRSVDEERVSATAGGELVHRVVALLPGEREAIEGFLDGLPERYLRTRTPEQVRAHFILSRRFPDDPIQIEFRYAPGVSEITLVTPDAPLLFATMAGTLAAWGMNIVTADGFANRRGVVIDSMRFTDGFRTLEMNESERGRLVASLHDVAAGTLSLDTLLKGRRRAAQREPMVKIAPRVEFDDAASSHSTLLQVVAQDAPGLLRSLSVTLARHRCNIEVALVDTEGEMAIDVFYLTRGGQKLAAEERVQLGRDLTALLSERSN